MAGMIVVPGQPGDDHRDARQRPECGGEAVPPRPLEQGRLHPAQLAPVEPRLPAQPAHRFQRLSAPAVPPVIPLMRGLPTHPQRPHDGGLPAAPRKPPGGLEAARFQGGHISTRSAPRRPWRPRDSQPSLSPWLLDAWLETGSRNVWARLLRLSGALARGGLAISLLVGHPAIALLGFGLVGLGVGNLIPILFSAAGRTQGTQAGTALAAVATTGSFGYLAGPPLIGLVAETAGLPAALAIVCVACGLVAAGAAIILPTRATLAALQAAKSEAITRNPEATHA